VVDNSPHPGPELLLSDEVMDMMQSQFDALDEDGGGTIEKHEVPPGTTKQIANSSLTQVQIHTHTT
jgi:hypothetical protein